MTSILRRLSRAAIRYGVQPEHVGPVSTITDDLYMERYLKSMEGWRPPSHHGGTVKDRQVARQKWAKVLAKVEGGAAKKGSNKAARAPRPTALKKAQRGAGVCQPRPVGGDQEPDNGKR